jgi:hypothetical protein
MIPPDGKQKGGGMSKDSVVNQRDPPAQRGTLSGHARNFPSP